MVVGASGFLGSNIVTSLRKEHKVIAMFRGQVIRYDGASHFMYSFDNKEYLKRVMTILKPDFVIYVAGMTDFMDCHKRPKMADAVNSLGPVVFGEAAGSVHHRFIYVSTAYVFNGVKGSYAEPDVPMAETTYGKTKLAGENYVRSKSQIYTILRCSPVYGLGSYAHPCFTDHMRMALARGQRFELPENEHHSFLFIDVLMNALEWIIKNESSNETYHLGGLTKLSTFEFGTDMAKRLGLDPTLITPTRGHFPDNAFLDFSLNSSKLVKNSQVDTLVLEQGLDLFQKLLIRGA